jgi:hypothetical protein
MSSADIERSVSTSAAPCVVTIPQIPHIEL